MAAYDPSATPQQLWDLILSTNPYLKQGIIQAPTFMKLNLGEAIKDDWWEQATSEGKQATYGPRTLLDVCFINTLPVPMALRHSRESGNPEGHHPRDWMPACAGMTFYWHRTYEMDI